MSAKRLNLVCGVALLLVTMLACKFSFTTANLSSLKISKDKAGSTPASSFGPKDTIYAVAEVSNAPGKTKLKGRLLFDSVAGYTSGSPLPGAETTIDMPGSGTGTFTFTPTPAGWPNGSYKVEVSMLNEEGEQKDQKIGTFSVSGGSSSTTSPPASAPANSNTSKPPTSESTNKAAGEDENDNDSSDN